jgi:hypothetical protein
MMGRQDRDQGQLFYEFSLDEIIPTDHLLRRINLFAPAVLADLSLPIFLDNRTFPLRGGKSRVGQERTLLKKTLPVRRP